MKFHIISVVLLIAAVSIASSAPSKIPKCILKKMKDILAEPVWNPPATISAYSYRGQTMYLSSSNCCDQFSYLYDELCKTICAPSGGFTGRGDGKCGDFQTMAKPLGKIWQDTRSS